MQKPEASISYHSNTKETAFNNPMKKTTYKLFLTTIPALLLFGFLQREDILDINIHDTYYIISYFHLAVALSLLFSLYALGNWFIRDKRNRILKWFQILHMAITFVGPTVVFCLSLLYKTEPMEYEFNNTLSIIIWGVMLFILLGQLLFPISLIYGLAKKKNNK